MNTIIKAVLFVSVGIALPVVTHAFDLPGDDIAFDQDIMNLRQKTTPPEKKKLTPAPRKIAKTPQEREEQNILDTFKQVGDLAKGLSNFSTSPEAKKIVDEKKKEREALVKKADDRRKQSGTHPWGRSSWDTGSGSKYGPYRPSSGGYSPSYGGYGSGSYGSSGYDGGYGRSSGGYTPSSIKGKYDQDIDDEYEDNEENKKPHTNVDDAKKPTYAKSSDYEKKDDASIAYNKALNTTKHAADALINTIDAIKEASSDDAKRGCKTITGWLDRVLASQEELVAYSTDKIHALDKAEELKTAKNKLDAILKDQVIPTLLKIITEHENTNEATELLKREDMTKHVKASKEAIERTAKKLFDSWEKNNKTAHNKSMKDLNALKNPTKATQTDVLMPTKKAVEDYFQSEKRSLEKIKNKLPLPTQILSEKIKSIETTIKDIEALP